MKPQIKRNYWEVMALALRAEMRYHAFQWRAERMAMFNSENREQSAASLDFAKTYRDLARSNEHMAQRERIPADSPLALD